jgi:Bacterial regulatory helix-turn-helix protein, lysR family
MSEGAQLRPAPPGGLVPVDGLARAHAGPTPWPGAGAGAPHGLELRHLRYSVALADAGTFTRAAERLFIAQPTLSQQIRRLEEIVGTPLLRRRREGLQLTRAGRVLRDASRTALAQVDTVDPQFEFTNPPLRCSLPVTLAFAAAANRPAAVLTGPVTAAGGQAEPIRRSGLAEASDMVRVSLRHHPLTVSAALVWNGDLPRPLQQMLFETADSLTAPAPSRPAELVALTTA